MMFVGKGTPTPGVPLVSLYPDFDKKATTFFATGYVLLHHILAEDADRKDFVNFAGNSGNFVVGFQSFAYLTQKVIHPVIGKTFPPPVHHSGANSWKTAWERGFSTLSTEFSTMGKLFPLYNLYKGWCSVNFEKRFALLTHPKAERRQKAGTVRQKPQKRMTKRRELCYTDICIISV